MSGPGGFTVPFSSSLPSTPDSRGSKSAGKGKSFPSFAENPSTTPAGPPPSSARSFTPAGPPPSSVFGSSPASFGTHLFQPKPRTQQTNGSSLAHSEAVPHVFGVTDNSPSRPRSQNPGTYGTDRNRGLHSTLSTPGRRSFTSNASDAEGYTDSEHDIGNESSGRGERDGQNPEDRDMEIDSVDNDFSEAESRSESSMGDIQSSAAVNWARRGFLAMVRQPPRGTKRSRGGTRQSRGGTSISHASTYRDDLQLVKHKDSAIPAVAKNLAKQIGPCHLTESDELIIETEKLVSELYPDVSGGQDANQLLSAALSFIPSALCTLWQSCCNQSRRPSATEYSVGIGPGENEPSLYMASFLGSLLLKLHHPPPAKGKQAFAVPQNKFPSQFTASLRPDGTAARQEPFPKVLLDWLDQNHNPYPTAMKDLRSHYPNATAHPNFWDIIFSAVLRGKLADVVHIFRDANFRHARSAQEEGQTEDGYRGVQLNNVTRVVNRAIDVVQSCPALQDEDWDIAGNEWSIFRHRVAQAMSDLAAFAEGRDRDLDPVESTFKAENFGMRSTSKTLSRTARQVQSNVPWTVYQNLKVMYGLLLGSTTELLSFSQDWAEATIALTVWWDGEDDDRIAVGSLAMTRRSLKRSRGRGPRSVDTEPGPAYLRRLATSFDKVTDSAGEDAFQIDSTNPVEVGLASIFEGNIESVMDLLRGWSLPITAAVMEVATQVGWYEPSPETGVMDDFDENDLMVLSYGRVEKSLSRDGLLVDYAQELFRREFLRDSRLDASIEGWELSIQILERLDDVALGCRNMGGILSRLPLDSDMRAEKIVKLCRTLCLPRDACEIAEKYADTVAENSDHYGTALKFYAQSHNAKKVKGVLDLLVSLCLVRSIAYPPLPAIDDTLRALITTPRDSILEIAEDDPEAAELLQFHLGGYATLRKFYDLRDEEVNLQEGQKPSLRNEARGKAAAAALLAVIASAADSIQGGLHDATKQTVVQVDGLLALLGEATIFVDQSSRMLSLPQMLSLLSAIEDLQTVHPRIYDQCQECFRSTIAAAKDIRPSFSSHELMKKSISSLTSSSGFSLIGSSMLEDHNDASDSGGANGLTNGTHERTTTPEKRGWDWRVGMKEGATGEDLLRMLRIGLAKDVAKAWIDPGEV
ncbi:hypothetical protein MMC26_000299 [Xylographa opegraphella]|nr:hypothetical protein [Xylographa opegraphella]